jgi:hypothetical protein
MSGVVTREISARTNEDLTNYVGPSGAYVGGTDITVFILSFFLLTAFNEFYSRYSATSAIPYFCQISEVLN